MSAEPLIQFGFDQMLDDVLLKQMKLLGIDSSFIIQVSMLAAILSGQNVVVEANHCMGKITGLCIAIVQKLKPTKSRRCQAQAIIAVPTWEIAREVSWLLTALGESVKNICNEPNNSESDRFDTKKIRKGVQVVVATPECIEELMRAQLYTGLVDVFALVEAQVLVKDEFMDSINYIRTNLPSDVQLISLSPVLPPDVSATVEDFVPEQLGVYFNNTNGEVMPRIRQYYVKVENRLEKFRELCIKMKSRDLQSITFCNTKETVDVVRGVADEEGLSIAAIHSGTSEAGRKCLLHQFLAGDRKHLVTMDMFPRCHLTKKVPLVLNYDVPTRFKDYFRRSRSCSDYEPYMSFVSDEEFPQMIEISKFFNFVLRKTNFL